MRRLLERRDFLAVRTGRRAHAGTVTVEALARGDRSEPRAGFTVTKKVGGSVERNRIRRRLREALNRVALLAQPGHDYVLIGRRPALEAPFATLVADIEMSLARVHGAKQARHRAESREETPT